MYTYGYEYEWLSSYRLDVPVQEAHGVDGLDGLQDLLPEPQCGAHGEGSSGLTPPQVGQVTTLRPKQHGGGHTAVVSPLNFLTLRISFLTTPVQKQFPV